ncbi:hypothetical protein GCM10009675_32330 [Prauserella alba]|uniref:3-hydroxyisobutyrate dehydrogenase n=1 Tax=Prauserella alba TaxID=176898 RepID=A0ABN1VHG8_9PSEU
MGRIYGAALVAAGHRVTAFDPYAQTLPEGVELRESAEAAVADVDVVLTLTAASVSRSVAETVVGTLRAGAVYADCTSSSPGDKRALAEVFKDRDDLRPADVAILGPVVQLGTETPLMSAGPGAESVAAVMTTVGSPVEIVDGALGDAMAHKFLRSVFMKGLASVVIEAVVAGRKAGLEEWVRGQIAGVLAGDGQAVIDRFLTGTGKHAERRMYEMRATSTYLAGLGAPSEMTDATATALERMTTEHHVHSGAQQD